VRAACKKRVTELTAVIPTVVFLVKDSTGRDQTEVQVSMDGETLADHLDGSPLAVDSGQHHFTFEVAGQPSFDQSFLIDQGNRGRRESITLPAPPPPAPPPEAAVATSETTPGAAAGGSSHGPWRPVAFGVGGVGVAGLIVGGGTGGLAVSKWNASQSECASAAQCPQHSQSVSDHNSASGLATVSTIAFVAGGVAVAGAALLFFMAPGKAEANTTPGATSVRVIPSVGPGGGSLTVRGVF
jgi:hypothetical protein